ncbi:MAG: RIP metalloprotease [Chloroflexi bacterium]|nr:RIP metalloprotease [Chloroflexota bacterium]
MTGLIQSIITVILFLGILGALVVIHELGHFVVARLARVRVLEFGVGFPPRARVLRSKGETLYTLNWLPIGGFVKLEGEDGDMADDPRSFSVQPLPIKLLILVAGVAMNVLLAFVIFTAIALGGDPTLGVRIGAVQPDSPASTAGLQAGDAIVSIDGGYYGAFDGVSLLGDLRTRAGQRIELGVDRVDGRHDVVPVQLREQAAIDADRGALGIEQMSPVTTSAAIHYTVGEAVGIGAQRTGQALGLIVGGLGSLASAIIERPTAAPPVAGPVGIATQIGDVFWQLGPIITLYVAGILSANLAVVNVLPFPPLDGGRMLMIVLKRLFGARISLRAEQMTYLVGFVFLFAFLIWITGFDIVRGLAGGS